MTASRPGARSRTLRWMKCTHSSPVRLCRSTHTCHPPQVPCPDSFVSIHPCLRAAVTFRLAASDGLDLAPGSECPTGKASALLWQSATRVDTVCSHVCAQYLQNTHLDRHQATRQPRAASLGNKTLRRDRQSSTHRFRRSRPTPPAMLRRKARHRPASLLSSSSSSSRQQQRQGGGTSRHRNRRQTPQPSGRSARRAAARKRRTSRSQRPRRSRASLSAAGCAARRSQRSAAPLRRRPSAALLKLVLSPAHTSLDQLVHTRRSCPARLPPGRRQPRPLPRLEVRRLLLSRRP
jgi:hypothetical protein